ncbi:MAG: DNA translocase FtsK 4TM domain-containing protein, partial [Acidimicrobiia bacterium]|nr:DNA translocase FtsK 4TM domain-containing protein [Acidimicrobiia bacterium]
MTTWGPSKKRNTTARSSRARDTSTDRSSSRSRATADGPAGRSRSTRREPAPTRREQATTELRQAVEGREHEFLGIGLIGAGIVLGLAIYLDVAGPLGRGIETLVGWFTGLGRFGVPLALVAGGVALVRKGQSTSPFRLAIGWSLVFVAALGLLHVAAGPRGFGTLEEVGGGGGWIGALFAEPMRGLLATAGAVVVLLALGLGGLLLITQTSVRTMAARTGRGVATVARPLGRSARQALRELSSLSSDRGDTAIDTTSRSLRRGRPVGELPPPSLYDAADDFGEPPAPPRRRRSSMPGVGPAADPGPGAQMGEWKLPPNSVLRRTGAQAVNRAEVEARGRVLQESLEQHGVDTSL